MICAVSSLLYSSDTSGKRYLINSEIDLLNQHLRDVTNELKNGINELNLDMNCGTVLNFKWFESSDALGMKIVRSIAKVLDAQGLDNSQIQLEHFHLRFGDTVISGKLQDDESYNMIISR